MLAVFIMEQKSSNYFFGGWLENILPIGTINASHGPDVSHTHKRKAMFVKSCQTGDFMGRHKTLVERK